MLYLICQLIEKISKLESLQWTSTNGDAKAFDEIKEKWGFVDDASLLRFAMAAMLSSVDNTLSITGENGNTRKIEPADGFTKKSNKK